MYHLRRTLLLLMALACDPAAAQAPYGGVEVPGSDTPIKRPDFIHENPQPGYFKFSKKKGSAAEPYNCLANAKGHRDVWVQPGTAMTGLKGGKGAQTATMAQILAANGCTVVPCAAPPETTMCTPPLQLVWLTYHLPAGATVPAGLPPDTNWVHAMRKAPDGWTSKDGDYVRHDCVTDPYALLRDQYPPYPGNQEVIRCACCPIQDTSTACGSTTTTTPGAATSTSTTTQPGATTTTTMLGQAVMLQQTLSPAFPSGATVCLQRIAGGRLAEHMAGCSGLHLHAATPAGITIDGTGPYPDPDEPGCGYGRIVAASCPP